MRVWTCDQSERTHFLALLTTRELALSEVPLPRVAEPSDAPLIPICQAITASEGDWVAAVESDLEGLFRQSAAGLAKMLDPSVPSLAILLPRLEPPSHEARSDGAVTSFVCTAGLFLKLIGKYPGCSPTRLCFLLLKEIMGGELEVDRLFVSQLPLRDWIAAREPAPARGSTTLMMAHRGRIDHLDAALRFIALALEPPPSVRVGLDGGAIDEYVPLMERYPDCRFFHFSPAPLGPYVIRHELAQRSSEDVLAFHDSDDVSTWDRFARLSGVLQIHACDMVGSHELRVDEMRERVNALRFPLDVSAALQHRPCHSLLHATAMISREAYFRAGGLSTDQIVANDTQFLFRAHFQLRIRNCDEFLYLRRSHEHALTVHPSTGSRIPLRSELDRMWRADFEAIKQGARRIEDSSLWPAHRTAAYQVTALPLSPETAQLLGP